MGSYIRPRALDAALRARAAGPCAVLAGGTDFYPARVGRTVGEDVLDITALASLRGVREEPAHFRIGALTTWTDLVESPLPAWFDAVKLAAREVGGLQIQNAATIAGTLCNASPAADGVPPLLALGAEVELQSLRGLRRLPLAEFVLGNRRTACQADELVTAVFVPKWGSQSRSTFLKLGARRYLVISIVMVAVVAELHGDGTIAGPPSPSALAQSRSVSARLRQHLVGWLAGHRRAVTPEHLARWHPLPTSGHGGSAHDAATLVARALERLADE
jgi:CO/xanthine dehydrogenase FAD-binding subunit